METSIELWEKLQKGIRRQTVGADLHDILDKVTEDILKGNMPWERADLFVTVCWELATLDTALLERLLAEFQCAYRRTKVLEEKKVFKFMREAQEYDRWVDAHIKLDEAIHHVDDALN